MQGYDIEFIVDVLFVISFFIMFILSLILYFKKMKKSAKYILLFIFIIDSLCLLTLFILEEARSIDLTFGSIVGLMILDIMGIFLLLPLGIKSLEKYKLEKKKERGQGDEGFQKCDNDVEF